jgi:hypothetical protein
VARSDVDHVADADVELGPVVQDEVDLPLEDVTNVMRLA